jgi:predicted nucleic acid-binding protein
MSVVILDTGLWYGLLDPADPYHAKAASHAYIIENGANTILFPWPIAYEILRTKFTKNERAMEKLSRVLKSRNVGIEDDALFRHDAMEHCWQACHLQKRSLSLVDCVLRLMIEDPNLRVDVFVTFNPGDFHDACRRKQVEMIAP